MRSEIEKTLDDVIKELQNLQELGKGSYIVQGHYTAPVRVIVTEHYKIITID